MVTAAHTETAITLAPETVRGLSLTASVDGYLLNVTAAATWSFDAATDGTGAKVVGRYTSTVRWQIPR